MSFCFKKLFTYDYYLRKYISFLERIHSPNLVFAQARRRYYWTKFKKLHYCHPKDIDEKCLWLSRYYQDPLKSECTDKYLVRHYVEKKGLAQLLVPLLGVWDNANDIDFDSLPQKFVLKCNHGSGWNIICKDKRTLDREETISQLNSWLGMVYGADLQEIHYAKIKPRIICEEFMPALNDDIIDYKFFCSRGKVHSCFVAYNRDIHNPHLVCYDHYDINWNRTDDIKEEYHRDRRMLPRPKHYDEMLAISSRLSEDFDFVRVDLYDCESQVFFGELTFTPYSGIMTFYNQSFLNELGRFVKLPKKKKF